MDRRFVLAIVLMMAVLLLPPLILNRRSTPPAGQQTAASSTSTEAAPVPGTPVTPAPPPAVLAPTSQEPAALAQDTLPQSIVQVTSPLYRFEFSTRGARMVSATLFKYQSMRPGEKDRQAEILPDQSDFLAPMVLIGRDTVRADDWQFTPSSLQVEVADTPTLTFTAARDSGVSIELTYHFRPDSYKIDVTGSVTGVGPEGGTLLLGMGPGLRNTESDSVEHARELGIVTRTTRSDLTHFSKLKLGEPVALPGPFEWVAVKAKYFATALLALDTTRAGHGGIGGVQVSATDTRHKTPEAATIWASLGVPASGEVHFSLYVGPMEYPRLNAIGHGFDDINPYGWSWLRPIIRPVAIGARWLLVWFHDRLHLAYGLGLILIGILIRVVLWPLNQKAMRAGMQMQAIQPLLKEIQDKHKDEPQKLQQEMFKIYKEHKVNPFSGCWPLLLPWPILIALFFVFQNTIELRGASFLWLPDLARPDPTYIIPVLMGVSMFAVTKVGQIGLPPNPQMKVMLYLMPGMMIVFFLGLASGLNLYYATVNLASIPQQWMVAQERLRNQSAGALPPTKPKPARKQPKPDQG
jgi:YidC/Oxa1 family membrane protein insertase